MRLDVIDEKSKIPHICAKPHIEKRPDYGDGTKHGVNGRVEDHSPDQARIRSKQICPPDDAYAQRCGDNIPEDRNEPDYRVPAHKDPRMWETMLRIQQYGRPLQSIEDARVLFVPCFAIGRYRRAHIGQT